MESDLKSQNISQIKEEVEEEISLDMLLQNNMPLEDYKEALVYFDTENTLITNKNKELLTKTLSLEKKNTELEKKIRLLEEENITHTKPSTRVQTELLLDQNKTLKYRNTELEKKIDKHKEQLINVSQTYQTLLESKQKEIDKLNMTVQYALSSESKQNEKYVNLSNESKCLLSEKQREIARLRKIQREAIKDKHLIAQLKTENDTFSDVRLMSELRERERKAERMSEKTNPPDLEIPIGPGNYNNVDDCTIC
jgi:hypothetical protein